MNQSRQFLINASAHDIPLPDGMIHTVVTSPPYYSLRKYAGEQQVEWPTVEYSPMPGLPPIRIQGCEPDCEHEWGAAPVHRQSTPKARAGRFGDGGGRGRVEKPSEQITITEGGQYCQRCGGWRGALGLEPTPEAYIGHLVLCFREVRRVLRDDGTCWVVVGDSFASQGGPEPAQTKWQVEGASDGQANGQSRRPTSGLHAGDLMGIPHRLMFALQADGWLCRNDVCWSKKSPMPESLSGWRWERCRVKVGSDKGAGKQPTNPGSLTAQNGGVDVAHWTPCPGCDKCRETGGYVLRRGSWRHTRAHETVLMLARGMGYFADQERVREKHKPESIKRMKSPFKGFRDRYDGNNPKIGNFENYLDRPEGWGGVGGRNPRSVLTPRPSNYKGAHYAVFSPDLIAPLLRATAPTRVCPVCGAPWAPVVERETHYMAYPDGRTVSDSGKWSREDRAMGRTSGNVSIKAGPVVNSTVLAHRSTCDHDADPVPGWVLDPFVGSGTTLEVCGELAVNAIGLDISLNYLDEHAKPRIGLTPSGALDTLPLFAELES